MNRAQSTIEIAAYLSQPIPASCLNCCDFHLICYRMYFTLSNGPSDLDGWEGASILSHLVGAAQRGVQIRIVQVCSLRIGPLCLSLSPLLSPPSRCLPECFFCFDSPLICGHSNNHLPPSRIMTACGWPQWVTLRCTTSTGHRLSGMAYLSFLNTYLAFLNASVSGLIL